MCYIPHQCLAIQDKVETKATRPKRDLEESQMAIGRDIHTDVIYSHGNSISKVICVINPLCTVYKYMATCKILSSQRYI